MAISRSQILKLGVSYGTGIMNHGNDQLVYDRALRAFPANGEYAAMRAAIEDADIEQALTHAKAFRQLCGDLAISELFVRTTPIIDSLSEEELPAVDVVEHLDEAYVEVRDYLARA